MSIFNNRVCRTCGVTFSGGPRAWYCPECRRERALISQRKSNARQRAGTSRKLGSNDSCDKCGKKYIVNGPNQRYCPACAEIVHKEVDNKQSIEYYYNDVRPNLDERNRKRREYYARNKEEINRKRRLKCKKSKSNKTS